MKWWSRLTVVQKVVLVTLVVCIIGTSGSLLLPYPMWPFSFLGLAAVAVNAVWYVRNGMNAPVPGRPELSKPSDAPTRD